jgi:hypothetical protein
VKTPTFGRTSALKHIRSCIFGLSPTINLAYSGAALSANTGNVILRDKDNAICNLPAPPPGTRKLYSFENGTIPAPSACKDWNNKARSIQLAEVPSTTFIILANRGNCASADAPWLHLQAINKNTSTKIIEIEYLATFQANQIIQKGLQLVRSNPGTDIRDKISCVSIETSATPSSSSTATP